MFSYVAKSLLSKTLKTFLSSYLEDIQLDGINYGGDSNNNTSSGWGVKLSNVKLREGMELMKLPGKRKRIVRKKKVKNKREQVPDVDADLTPRVGNNSHKKVIHVAEENQQSLPLQPGYDETLVDMAHTQIIDIENTPQLPLHEKIQNRDRITSLDSAGGYFSLDTGPSTPTQGNGLCGGRSSAFCNGNSRQVAEQQVKEAVGEKLPLPSFNDEESNDITIDTPLEKEMDQSKDPTEFTTPIEDDNDSFMEEEEEEVVVEDDMALLVGAGGSIGTLNIRLVGKELHVTVEDAHLILEAVPNEPDEEDADAKSKAQKPSNIDRSTSSSSVSSEAEMSATDENNEVEPTIGEKIKKKSLMAKYLSMIPHLFLRDCRVSLILPEDVEKESPSDDIDDCTLFELGIDFLSVTSGDDFMDTLRFDTGNSNTTPIPKSKVLRRSSSMGSAISEGKQNQNQTTKSNIFARKRIRTGKGPDGGIWLTIKPPIDKMLQPPRTKEIWSRRRFIDTSESFFLRFSGLDLHARMLMRREDEVVDNLDNEYEDYTLDSMLFGVDYIDPISLNKHQVRKSMEARHQSLTDESIDIKNSTDKNGIESIQHPSNFHWIAQQQHKRQCTNSHLPLKDCFDCWNECVKDDKVISSSSMDSLMPMPGLVLCLSVTDPLEVNVDRNHLEALGYLKSLFASKKEPVNEDEGQKQDETIHANDTTKAVYTKDNTAQSTFDDKSFPSYMTPDCIYLSGIYVSKLIIRVEALQLRTSSSLKFRYWEFIGQSIHVEESQVDADEQYTRDMTFHIGKMECNDFIGVCSKHLVVAGVDIEEPNSNDDGVVSIPCAASCILGVPYPTTNIKTYALHARVIRSDFPSISSSRIGYVNLKMGIVNVDVDSTLMSDVSRVSNEAKSIVIGCMTKKKTKKSLSKSDKKDAVHWLYQISTVGGSISYQPKIKMKIPESSIRMRRGSEGFSFETYLHKLGMEYGSYSFNKPQLPSILPLCLLPGSLRMHILLYLDDDLASLERVLNIKKKKKASAFLRGHAVNKKLSKLGVSASMKKIKAPPVQTEEEEVLRRNNALNKLKSLDTDSLVALLSIHDNKLHMN